MATKTDHITDDQKLLQNAKEARRKELEKQLDLEFSKPEILQKLKSQKVLENNKKTVDDLIEKHGKALADAEVIFKQLQQAKKDLTELARTHTLPIARQYVYKTPSTGTRSSSKATAVTFESLKAFIDDSPSKIAMTKTILIQFDLTTAQLSKRLKDMGFSESVPVVNGIERIALGTSVGYKLYGN